MATHLRALALLVLALGAGTTGCGAATSGLDGHAYLSTAITENGAPRALVAGTRIRLDFRASELGVSAGCNSMSGTYRIDGDRLVLDGVSTTAIGCEPDRHAQDAWVAAFLTSRPTIRLTGNELILDNATTSIRLLDREVAEPDLTLVGPTWTVDSIISGDAVSSLPQGTSASLLFRADGTFDLDAGCNRGGGRWQLEGSGLRLSEIALTKMACDQPRAGVESAVLQVLQGTSVAATIDSNVLTLRAGQAGLQLRGARGA